MSGLSHEQFPPPTGAEEPSERTLAVRDGLTSLAIVLAWFGAAALIAAVVWWQVTPLAEFTRTADNATMDEEQLAKQFGTDGWFVTIAAVAGLISGIALIMLRQRNPILMVVLIAAGGVFATLVMLRVGLVLGPSDPSTVFASTPVGGTVPLQLKPTADAVWFVWSVTALAGSILALWISEAREESAQTIAAAQAPTPWLPNDR